MNETVLHHKDELTCLRLASFHTSSKQCQLSESQCVRLEFRDNKFVFYEHAVELYIQLCHEGDKFKPQKTPPTVTGKWAHLDAANEGEYHISLTHTTTDIALI